MERNRHAILSKLGPILSKLGPILQILMPCFSKLGPFLQNRCVFKKRESYLNLSKPICTKAFPRGVSLLEMYLTLTSDVSLRPEVRVR